MGLFDYRGRSCKTGRAWRSGFLLGMAGLCLPNPLVGPIVGAQAQSLSDSGWLRGTTGAETIAPTSSDSFPQMDPIATISSQQDGSALPIPDPASGAASAELAGGPAAGTASAFAIDPITTAGRAGRSNTAAAPEQTGLPAATVDPFAAVGMRIGTWRVYSTLDQSIGYSSNTGSEAMGDGGSFSQTDLSVSAQSDWARHSARFDAALGYRVYIDTEDEETPEASVSGEVNLDLADGFEADLGASYEYTTETGTSINVPASAVGRSGVHSTGGFVSLTRNPGRILLGLRGSVGRTDYEELTLSDGTTQSQDDRNNTELTATLRAGYEISPTLTPFVELEAGRKLYDLDKDRNGDNRDSRLYAARAGLAIDTGGKLRGELAAGYEREVFDEGFEALDGLTFDGSLIWSPVRDTEIEFSASTDFTGATVSGENGEIVNSAGIAVKRQVNSRLALDADAGVTVVRQDDGSQTDTAWSFGTGFQYWFNRHFALIGSVDHTTQLSDDPSSAYDETVVQGGIRLQH